MINGFIKTLQCILIGTSNKLLTIAAIEPGKGLRGKPFSITFKFYTYVDNQIGILIHITVTIKKILALLCDVAAAALIVI